MRLLLFLIFSLCFLEVLSSQTILKVRKAGKCGWINENGQAIIPIQYDDTRDFSENMLAVNKGAKYVDLGYEGGKWGYCNEKGIEVILPQFDEVADFKMGLAAVKKGKKYGYIDTKGQLQIPFRYDVATDFSENLAAVKIQNKWGFINKQGQLVIPAVYDYATEFQHGLARVFSENFRAEGKDEDGNDDLTVDGKYGLIDTKGNLVLDTLYDELDYFIDGYARVRRSGREGFVDSTGKIAIPLIYHRVTQFSEGLSAVAIRDTLGPFTKDEVLDSIRTVAEIMMAAWQEEKDLPNLDFWFINPIFTALHQAYQQHESNAVKYGYIDHTGKTIIPFKYSEASPFFKGFAQVHIGKQYHGYAYRFTKEQLRLPSLNEMARMGTNLIDKTGQEIFDQPFSYLIYYPEGIVIADNYHGDQVYQNGQEWEALGISTKGFKHPSFLGYGLFTAQLEDNTAGNVYNAAGTKILESPLVKEWIFAMSAQRILVGATLGANDETKYGIMDLQGKWVVQPIYDQIF